MNNEKRVKNFGKRFFYWTDPEEIEPLRIKLRQRRVRLTPVSGVPCKALHPLMDYAFVPPEAWDDVCARQGAWYRNSDKNGRVLLTASEPLPELKQNPEAFITPIRFTPHSWASHEDIAALASLPEYRESEPERWRQFTQRERRHWRNLLTRIGVNREISDLIDLHSANHANFIKPQFYESGPDGSVIPYSIRPTAGVCSACVELFNILGAEFKEKRVMPCPGFAIYAQFPEDVFLKVKRF